MGYLYMRTQKLTILEDKLKVESITKLTRKDKVYISFHSSHECLFTGCLENNFMCGVLTLERALQSMTELLVGLSQRQRFPRGKFDLLYIRV